jgi:tetratricopeptide (TPR) repeat protein
MLYPRYKIFMDMEVPFLFTNEDFYVATHTFVNKVFLEKIIVQYKPSFIVVPLQYYGFKELIGGFPDYKIVFFDDREALYAHKVHYPFIVNEFELKVIDPFALISNTANTLRQVKDVESLLGELLKIIKVYPDGLMANQCIAIIYNWQGNYEKALLYGEIIVKNYPELPIGYQIRGDSFKGLNMLDKAIKNYKIVLKKQDNPEIHKELGLIYFKQHKYREAYNTLVRVVNFYTPGTTYRDLYYLIVSALESDKIREAEILFRYAYQSVPPGDKEWYEKYQELQTKIQEPGAIIQEPE